jgi:hypothetical protein
MRSVMVVVALVPLACGLRGQLSPSEMREAVEEASFESQASALTGNTVEITTNFTIGKAVEEAAEELRAFYASQLPCAAVSREGRTVSVEYGANGGECLHRGQRFTGRHSVTVERTEPGEVQVSHSWESLSNGRVKVDGTAVVTWSSTDQSRRIRHDVTWTRLSDGLGGTGTGERTQRPLASGLAEGFRIDGERTWAGARGDWSLSIDGVQMRWQDPVPQAGRYTLDTPKGVTVTLDFERVDETTIKVTFDNGRRTRTFNVRSTGAIDDGGES